jgi:hypothetical protein
VATVALLAATIAPAAAAPLGDPGGGGPADRPAGPAKPDYYVQRHCEKREISDFQVLVW